MRNYYKILPNITKINKPEVIFTDRASIKKQEYLRIRHNFASLLLG